MGRDAVLVTGASSGIGEQLARRLACERRDLVLVARRVDRLEELAATLRAQHGVAVDVVPQDLGAPGGPDALVAELAQRGLDVDWLVNNAGFGTSGPFFRLPVEREVEQVRLNMRAPVALAGRLLPGMVARGRGLVMNVASVAGYGPMPYTATYAATKAFLIAWSEALAVEMEGTGVRVLCVCPGFTRTEFQAVAKAKTDMVPAFAWMSAEAVADQAVRAAKGRSGVLVNGLLNNLMTVGMRLAPRRLLARVTAGAMRGRL
ncbi:MAG: SDR family oxidoreductase [bacterium]|nr:SDR family oxidoreductase [bacterium]